MVYTAKFARPVQIPDIPGCVRAGAGDVSARLDAVLRLLSDATRPAIAWFRRYFGEKRHV